MKIKNVLLTLGMALAMGVSVAVGVNTNKAAGAEADATYSNWQLSWGGVGNHYNTTLSQDSKSMDVTYSFANGGVEAYSSFLKFDITGDSTSERVMSFKINNTGDRRIFLRVDVMADNNQSSHWVNASATKNGEPIYTDLTYGGSSCYIASGEESTISITYTDDGYAFQLSLDAARQNSDTSDRDESNGYSGSVTLSELLFGEVEDDEPGEVLTLTAKDAVYNVSMAANKKSATVSYENINGHGYANLSFAAHNEHASDHKLVFYAENNGENTANVRVDVISSVSVKNNPNGQPLYVANAWCLLDGATGPYTDLDWGGSSFTLTSGQKAKVEVFYINSASSIVFFLDSSMYGDMNTYTGQITLSNFSYESNYQRINVFVDKASYWDNDGAKTYLNFSGNYSLFEADEDVDTINLTRGQTAVEAMVLSKYVDLYSLGTYDNVGARRQSADGSSWWTNDMWGFSLENLKNGTDNTVIISGNDTDHTNVESFGRWYKVKTYSNKESYASLDGADTTVSFMLAGSVVANPKNAPDNTSFHAWYTDAALTQEWIGPIQSDLTLYARYVGQEYQITQYAVLDGVVASTKLDIKNCPAGDTYEVPGAVSRPGYHFVGWYDENGNELKDFTVEGNKAIYAYMNSRSEYTPDSYIYYVTDLPYNEETPNKIYTFGGEYEFGSGQGTLITSVATEVHGDLNFENKATDGRAIKIYLIPINTVFGDTKLQIVYSDSDKTAEMRLVPGAAYWWSNDPDYFNSEAGAALDFLLKVEGTRKAVNADAQEHIAEDSICGIASGTAGAYYNEYTLLDDGVKAYIDSTKVYTYSGEYGSEKGMVRYADVMIQLGKRGGVLPQNASFMMLANISENGSPIIIIVIATFLGSALLLSVFLVSKKRKQ